MSFCPYAPREFSVLTELTLGHLRCLFEGVPPQPNFLSGLVSSYFLFNKERIKISVVPRRVGVFHSRPKSLLPSLHPRWNYAAPDQSEALQGLLAPLDDMCPLPHLLVRCATVWDSENLIDPFMQVTN